MLPALRVLILESIPPGESDITRAPSAATRAHHIPIIPPQQAIFVDTDDPKGISLLTRTMSATMMSD
ncbi:hypothetical protein H4Q26_004815 [Puccinia striiformis f. sp. tritici PST-130]|nr:hypothetical protein H4Q26_004815 [Puccinia striiformis f. sp. tritici PST-130]